MQPVAIEASSRQAAEDAAHSERAVLVCNRVARVCGWTVVAIGTLVLLGNVLERLHGRPNRFLTLLAGQILPDDMGDTGMALTTALGFLLCGVALILLARHPGMLQLVTAKLAAALVMLWSFYHLVVSAIGISNPGRSELYKVVDQLLIPSATPMSPLSAFLFIGAALGLLSLSSQRARARAWASAFALLIGLIAAVILLGFCHGVQLLQLFELIQFDLQLFDIVQTIPLALSVSAAFAVLSLGMLSLVGPKNFPIREFLDSDTRALLLRSFLPVVLALILFDGIFRSHLANHQFDNHAQTMDTILGEKYLSEGELIRLVRDQIESDPDLLRQVEAWAYTHSHEKKLGHSAAESRPNLNEYWNRLDPHARLMQYRSYMRNLQLQELSLFSAMLAALSVAALTLLIRYTSRRIGDTIDDAKRARDQALEQMRQARDDAEAANRAKGRFLAKVNHELKQPLNAIILYAQEAMAEHAADPALQADLKIIRDRGEYLDLMIKDIVTYSELGEGKVVLRPEVFAPSDVARDVATTIERLAKKNGNKLCVECPREIGTMHADVFRVKECLLNLLSNADKFTSNGTITLSVSRDTDENQDWIKFQVSDTGIGMTPSQQELLFQPFVQVHDRTTRPTRGGLGLGLSISRDLSRLMGGELFLERSEPNVGSTFTLSLPAGTPLSAPEARRLPSVVEPTNRMLQNTILVIDDDRDVREILIRQLSKEGFRVFGAGYGEEALRLAREVHPQVITLDVIMPGMDGWSVLTTLKSDPSTADIPVVIVSIIDDKNLGYALGASDYLVKPVQGDRLIDVLKRFCNFPSSGLALIAEDDSIMRDLLRRVLEKEKWTVVEAINGREALVLMAQQQPSLILLDLMMPEMDGLEFLAELQHHADWSAIPIVVITAKQLAEEGRTFSNGSTPLSGCVKRVLQKGKFSREELLSQVRQLVARGAAVWSKS